MWVNGQFDWNGQNVTFCAKVYTVNNDFGIDEGRVLKLDLRSNDRLIADYDRGWEYYPESKEDEEVLEKFLELIAHKA